MKNIDPDLHDEIIHNHDCETYYDGSSSKLGFVYQRTENKSMLNFCVGRMESQGIQDIFRQGGKSGSRDPVGSNGIHWDPLGSVGSIGIRGIHWNPLGSIRFRPYSLI